MLGKYTFVETFKVTNLVSFDVGIRGLNSRTNFPKEGGDDDRDQGRPLDLRGRIP